MVSLCLIGNSHLAALKLGWPQVQPRFPDVGLTFFASAGQSLQLEISGGKLVAPDERIRHRLALVSEKNGDIEPVYDAYVLCGLTLSFMRALQAYSIKLAELRAAGPVEGLATDVLAEAMGPTLRGSIAADVAAKLRQLTRAPIFLVATPLPAYERHAELWDRIRATGEETRIAQAYDLSCRKLAQDVSATFVPQPAETVGINGLTTRNVFYLLRPDQVATEKAQHTHMNPDFGAIILRNVLEQGTS